MRWLLATMNEVDQFYAEAVLLSLNKTGAVVPNLWHLEVTNVLSTAIKRGDIDCKTAETFLAQLQDLPIEVDADTHRQAFFGVFKLCNEQGLSSYDAAYLALAMRRNLPIATLDKQLLNAAQRVGVTFYNASQD